MILFGHIMEICYHQIVRKQYDMKIGLNRTKEDFMSCTKFSAF